VCEASLEAMQLPEFREVTMSLDLSDDNFGALLVAATILSVGVGALWLHTFAGML
jgi:hypothetical protein